MPVDAPEFGYVTHYGEQYNGLPLACGGTYTSGNPWIIAVGPGRYWEWPCGTYLRVCGASGCIVGTRVDSCPGCVRNVLDLSEAGIALVCGDWASTCEVVFERVEVQWLPLDDPPPEGEDQAQLY